MEQTMFVEEDRNFINKAKSFMDKSQQALENIRKEYKEKYVDTGKSQEFEEKIEKRAKAAKKTIRIAGTLATVALMFCPADGPFGEICTALATPGLCALVDVAANIKKKAIITGKRGVEKHLLKVDGSNGNVSAYNLENGEIIDDFKELTKQINEISTSWSI